MVLLLCAGTWSMLPPMTLSNLSNLPTAPRADVSVPTVHRRQPRLGTGEELAGGVPAPAHPPAKSKLLSHCHAATVIAKN